MPNPDVTVFFRDMSKWKSPSPDSKEPELNNSKVLLTEIISDRDVKTLYDLSMCILHIRKKAQDEDSKITYDNRALEEFMNEFTLMIDEISRKKNIKDYISHIMGARFGIDVPVKYQ
jgi:hypothetical protein